MGADENAVADGDPFGNERKRLDLYAIADAHLLANLERQFTESWAAVVKLVIAATNLKTHGILFMPAVIERVMHVVSFVGVVVSLLACRVSLAIVKLVARDAELHTREGPGSGTGPK